MADPFDACWLRVDRASAHRVELADLWHKFIEDEPYEFALDYEGKGRFLLRVFEQDSPPPEMAVVFGEWLYNLRAALDYTVYATAICVTGSRRPAGHDQLQWPVYDRPELFTENLYRLKPLADHHRDLLEKVQPYRHPDPDTSALGWLHRLAKIDRHRRLTVQTAYMAEMSPVFYAPPGCNIKLQWGDRVIRPDHQAQIARIKVTPWRDDWELQANPQTGIDPEIGEWAGSPFWANIPYNQRLRMLSLYVESMVATFEYDCIGSTRRAKFLTDAFRAESDARRQPLRIAPHQIPATRWGPARPADVIERSSASDGSTPSPT